MDRDRYKLQTISVIVYVVNAWFRFFRRRQWSFEIYYV